MSPSSVASDELAGEVHVRFLAIAQDLSEDLVGAIARNGPLALVPHQTEPFAQRLCRAVAGQQLSVKAARSIWQRVIASAPAGRDLIAHFEMVEPDQLRGCGLSGAKVKTIRGIAQAAQAGQLEPAELASLNHVERSQRLTALWGVGQWTADMMGIFYFADPDIWPSGDVATCKTLERLTSKRRKLSRTAARFAPYRSYLALHMWRYADIGPIS